MRTLNVSHGSGVGTGVSKQNQNTERVARRKRTVSLREPSTEPPPTAPVADADALSVFVPPEASAEDVDESALARLDDDGSPASGVRTDLPPTDGVLPPSVAVEADTPPEDVSRNTTSLEQRVRRLENALESLQSRFTEEPRLAESPPVARVADPMPAPPAPPAPTAILVDLGKRLLNSDAPSVAPTAIVVPNLSQSAMRGSLLWLLWDTWAEARSIVRMFVDPRYPMPRSTRFLPLLLLVAILTSYYWLPGTSIPVIGSWINKAFDLLLAFVLIKWLGHEARRYRRTSPDLPPQLRL